MLWSKNTKKNYVESLCIYMTGYALKTSYYAKTKSLKYSVKKKPILYLMQPFVSNIVSKWDCSEIEITHPYLWVSNL